MLDSDIYPSHEWEEHSSKPARRESTAAEANSSKSPVSLDAASMAQEGIPMTANPRELNLHFIGGSTAVAARAPAQLQAMLRAQQQQRQMMAMQWNNVSAQIVGLPPVVQQRMVQQHVFLRQQAQQHAIQAQQQAQLQAQAQAQNHMQQQVLAQQQARTLLTNSVLVQSSNVQSLGVFTGQPAPSDRDTTIVGTQDHDFTSHEELYASPSPAPQASSQAMQYQVDDIDVGCFAHVNLGKDWYAEAGPSSSKRRVDSGFVEGENVTDVMVGVGEVEYTGKGKGKMVIEEGVGSAVDMEVICID